MNYWDQIKCFISHKWIYKKEKVIHKIGCIYTNQDFDYPYDHDVRICQRCFYKKMRYHHTGDSKVDWIEVKLNKEEVREKKFKELGI